MIVKLFFFRSPVCYATNKLCKDGKMKKKIDKIKNQILNN